jgi:ActR/RegA family two-component response regulator
LLFVDDEQAIRITLPAILSRFGFDVTSAADVPEALRLIADQPFDALVSDLNIGQPGDGFTVVSAMRRTQPDATTFILTGYPAFETALEAIRQQVDDYLVKPADVTTLVEKIKAKLAAPRHTSHRVEVKRLAAILDGNKTEIMGRWLDAAKKDPQLNIRQLSDRELTDCLTAVIAEIISSAQGPRVSADALDAAQFHGKTRFQQGLTIPSMIREARLLHEAVSQIVQENLLGADVSSVVPDLMAIGESMQAFLEESIRAYVLAAREKPAPAA